MKAKITIKLVFAAVQGILAISTLVLAMLFYFNAFGIPDALGIAASALNFYVGMFAIFGITFLISSLFLIYEWWET